MQNKSSLKILTALANENRLQIMQWIADPLPHFPSQSDGDLVDDGVCVGSIATKIGLSQPTVTKHMGILADAGLVTHKKLKNWVFYRPDHKAIKAAMEQISKDLG